MSRLEPLAPPYPEDVSKTFAKLMPPGMPPLALFRVVARNPRVLRRMQRGGLLDPGSIPLRLRELTILRTTARCGAGYELAVHAAFFGGAAGFTREDIEAAARGAVSDPRWSAQERLALALADALHDEGDVGDTLHAELARAFSPAQHVELVMLVGLYHAVSFLCRAFRLPPEAGTEALAQLAGPHRTWSAHYHARFHGRSNGRCAHPGRQRFERRFAMTPAAATTAPAPDLRFAEGSPNEDFIRAWNTFLVPKFVDYRWQLTRGAAAHADEFLRGLPIPVGGRALDVGCGFGESLHDLSDRVGPTGSVLGVDVGETYLQIAASELHAAGRDNVSLLKADAQIHEFAPEFDFVWSRNGTGFFASPGLGFRNMRRALKPGGTMGIIVWRSVAENSFFAMTKEVALELLPEPENPATCGPGPFSLSNPERLRALLTRADFEDITIERSDALYPVGRDLDHAVDFVLAIGPAGEIIREAGALGIEKLPEIRQRLRTRFAAYLQDGAVLMPSAMWRVSARAAG